MAGNGRDGLKGLAVVSREQIERADRALISDVWTSSEPWNNLKALVSFGSRFSGTEGERQAVDYLVGKMEEYGLENVRAEEYRYNAWFRGSDTLHVLDPVEMEIPCIGLPYSPSGVVEAELASVGPGTPGQYYAAGNSLNGKIVMCSTLSPHYFRRGIHRMEKYGRAVEAGAKAFIWLREEGGYLEETGSVRFNREAEIPAIGIAKEYGAELQRMLAEGPVALRIESNHETRPTTSWNVVGELTGSTMPDRRMIVGAHFEGHDIAPGAMDDGSGAVTVMEVARALAQQRDSLGRSMTFICFSNEETGLIGAHAFADTHSNEFDSADFMLNLDGAGHDPAGKGIALQGFPELIATFQRLNRDMQESMLVDDVVSLYSDMYPFLVEGVPCATLANMTVTRTGRGWGHTKADTLDKVSPRDLRNVALLVSRLMLRASNVEEWPARRKSRDEVEQILINANWAEVLRYEDRLPIGHNRQGLA